MTNCKLPRNKYHASMVGHCEFCLNQELRDAFMAQKEVIERAEELLLCLSTLGESFRASDEWVRDNSNEVLSLIKSLKAGKPS